MKLLQHFKELTVRPKNAEELKGLILKLAIQGKLTPNWRVENSSIQSASKYLEQLKAEKEILIKQKEIRKEKPLPKIKKEEIISDLPKKWEMVRLGEIGDWGAGSTPLRSNPLFYDGEINWFKSGELNNGIIDFESKEKITELAIQKSSVRLNKPGDVLIAMYGATIGKTAILNVAGTTNQAVCACTPFSCISSSYLHLLLKALKDTFINQGEGGAQPNISRVKIRNQVFALPPLEEQKEIVNVVETLFKEVEQLEQLTVERISLKEDFVTSALQQFTTNNANQEWTYLQDHFKSFFNETRNIKKLRETVLQLAVQGKLTADWRANHPDTEDASVLLKRIQEKKAQLIKDKKIKKEKALPKITKEEIPYELPEGWVWTCLGNIGNAITGTTPPTKDPENYGTFIPFLGPADISNNSMKYPIEGLSEAGLKKGRLIESNSLMMVCIGGSMGKCNVNRKDVSCNQQINVLTPIFSPVDYVKIMCQTPYFQIEVWDRSTGSATPMINKNKWLHIPIALPPLEEQKAIVEKVNALMGLCDSLEQEVEQSQEYSEQLMQSCLREVFEA